MVHRQKCVFRLAAASTVFVTQTRVVYDYLEGTAQEVPAGSGSGELPPHPATLPSNTMQTMATMETKKRRVRGAKRRSSDMPTR